MRNQSLLFIGVLCILSLTDAHLALGQDPSVAHTWEASVRYDHDRLSDGREDWRRWTLSLQREGPIGTMIATFVRQRRFGVGDEGVEVDVWPDLWNGAYGHVKTGISPNARVRPQRTLQSEVFQSIGQWELAGRYSWQRYRNDNVHQFGPGLARYQGSWYLRTQTNLVPQASTWGLTQRLRVRRFYSSQPTLSYIDLAGGVGRSVELINANSELLVTQTFFVSLRLRHFLTQHLGLTASLQYSDDDVFQRTGGAVGIFATW